MKIKSIIVTVSIFFSVISLNAQRGAFTTTYKKWLQKEVIKENENNFFKGFKYTGGTLLQDDPEVELHLMQYQKGSTHLILLITQIKDALSYTIQDVIEIKNVGKNMNVQTTTCQQNGEYNSSIIGLTQNKKHIKTWYTDKDKLKFRKIDAQGINCFVEEAD
jgi:hypothetical protein